MEVPDRIFYKYLPFDGGLKMLQYSNLQFTNATKFNDPFDCHPALFDYSHAPVNEHNWPPADFLSLKGENEMERVRDRTWMCCLSKVHDSLLMWSYYNNHKGICIGLNKDKVLKCCNDRFFGFMFPFVREVNYKEIIQKPDYFNDDVSFVDLLTTKAKAWEHEKEERIITWNPAWVNAGRIIPGEFNEEEIVDGKEIRHYPQLSADCFESVYLGVNILPRNKTKIIKVARNLNPNIKIYQMTTDPKAFKLKAEQI